MPLSSTATGFIGVALAIVGFGTQGVFVKSKAIKQSGAHPLLVAGLFSGWLGLIGVVLGLVVASLEHESALPLTKSPDAGVAFKQGDWLQWTFPAILYAPGNILLLWACRRAGVGVGVGVCAAWTSVMSFVGGVTVGGDTLRPATQLPGVCLMIVATIFMAATKVPTFEDWVDPIPPHLLVEVLADLDQSGADGESKCIDPFDLSSPLIAEPEADYPNASSMPPPHNDELLSPEALASAEAADSPKPHRVFSSVPTGARASATKPTAAGAAHHGSPGFRHSLLSNEEGSTLHGGSQLEGGSGHGSTDRFSEGSGYTAGGGGGYITMPAEFARTRRTDPGVVATPWVAAGSALDHNHNDSMIDHSSSVSARGDQSSESAGNQTSTVSFMHESQFGGTLLLSPGQGAHVHSNNRLRKEPGNSTSQQGRTASEVSSQAHQLRRRCRQYRRRSSVAVAVARASSKATQHRRPLPRIASTSRINSSSVAKDNDASDQRMLTLAALVATATSPEVDWTGVMIAAASGLFLGVQAFLWSRALNSGHANKESDDNDDDGNLSPIEIMRAIAIFLATQFVVTALLLVWPAWSDPTFLNGLPRRPGGSSLSSRGSVSAGVGRGFTACRIALPWALGGAVCFAAALGGQVVAMAHLPLAEAGPLTQLNVAVAGMWGLGFLGEVESPRLKAVFAASIMVALCGAALLSLE